MFCFPHKLACPVVLLPLLLLLVPGNLQAQTDSTISVISPGPLAYPPALHEAQAPQRTETGLTARQQRYEDSTTNKVAKTPARILMIPLQILNYPLEKWLVRSEPPPYVLRALGAGRALLDRGFTVRFGGFGVGSSKGGGIGFRGVLPGAASTYGKIFVGATVAAYQQYYVQFDRRLGNSITLLSRTQYFDQPRIEFYGVGLQSNMDTLSSYRLQTTSMNLSGLTSLRRYSFFEWQIGFSRNKLARGLTPGIPASVEIFAPGEVEGLRGQHDLFEYGVGFGLDGRDNPGYAQRGTFVHASLLFGNALGQDSPQAFTKYILELQEFIPLPGARRTLAMRLHTVITDNRSSDGSDVPLWRLEQLGGSRSVRALDNFRYTDEDLVVANLEYRFPFWFLNHESGAAIDALTFFDVGTVLPDISRMQPRDLRSGAGFGFRVVSNRGSLFRVDFAWTSQDFRIHVDVRGSL